MGNSSFFNIFRLFLYGGEITWDMKKCLYVVSLLAFFLGFLLWFVGGSWDVYWLG